MILYILIIFCFLCIYIRIYMWKPPQVYWKKFIPSEGEVSCETDEDCLFTNQICFHQTCEETLVENCDPKTSFWAKGAADNQLKCVCKFPKKITQSEDGFNCAVDIACGLYGHLKHGDPVLDECVCDDKRFKVGSNHQCIRKTEIDADAATTCPKNHTLSSHRNPHFHKLYLKQFRLAAKCLRRPCSFNVLNGKPLKHSRLVFFDNGFRCVCDPRFGHFGVHLHVNHYLQTPPGAYNACASIFEDEPKYPNEHFKIYCYFYLPEKKPICFLLFSQLRDEGLLQQFRGHSTISISETFGEGIDQHELQRGKVKQKVTICDTDSWISKWGSNHDTSCKSTEEFVRIPNCTATPEEPYTIEPTAFQNNIYARHFVCKHAKEFGNKIIVNPYCIDWKKAYVKSHGYEFYRKKGVWYLKPAPMVDDHFPFENHSEKLMGKAWTFHQKPPRVVVQVPMFPRGRL